MANAGNSTPTKHGGKVEGASGKSQHVDLFRKLRLRRELLASASDGAVFAPFIGDGDIALELYADRLVLGADLDPERVKVAAARLPSSDVRVADCDGPYPFTDRAEPIAVADLDSYSNPYQALVHFWQAAPRTTPVVIFGTDGHRQTIQRQHKRIDLPSGKAHKVTPQESRRIGGRWWINHVLPFIAQAVSPAVVSRSVKYQRGPNMLYWGVLVGSADAAPSTTEDAVAKVEDALREAAESGNVAAALAYLQAKAPERWGQGKVSPTLSREEMASQLGYED